MYSAQALPVSIWMLRNFVATIPRELEEAAAIDGASGFRIFWRILFPLVAPGLVATSIFAFITAYNEFIVALTFLGQAHSDYTLPIYVTYFFGRGGAQWGPIMAASTMYTIPVIIFFLIVRRQARRRPGRGSREGMTRKPDADPSLGRLADAILIPPFPGGQEPEWIRAALGEGLAGVTLFGLNVQDRDQLAESDPPGCGRRPPSRSSPSMKRAVTSPGSRTSTGSDYPGNAALGAIDDVALTSAVYAALGADLRALGINLDLAPAGRRQHRRGQPRHRHQVVRLRPSAGRPARGRRSRRTAVGRRRRLREALSRPRQHAARLPSGARHRGCAAQRAEGTRPAAVRGRYRRRRARDHAEPPAGAGAHRRPACVPVGQRPDRAAAR